MKREPDRLIAAVQWEKQPEIFAERFVIEGEAGVGGTSIVYRAIDQTSGQTVALKLLRRTGPADLQRFDAEAEALETLRHPAIVRYIAHGVADGHQPYLAMEWVDGETLRLRLERGALDVDEVVMIGRRIADALAAAHASGILHRDIKPSNILLPRRALARAKVADFGLVRAIDIDSDGPKRDVTATGIIVGTPGYMAPEQAHGVRDLDARADLFSLGCLLFRCLTEIDAFEGSRALTALAKLVLLEPPRVAELRPDVPGSLDRLVAALLAKEREQRPASAAEVREKLESIAERMRAAAPHYIESRRDESRRDRKVPASTPGSVFGRYVLEGRLGEGGMGEVFRAHDTTLARAVALKILRGSPDHATSELLVREARAAAVLSHPNIVTIYDVGEQDGVPFLAMECVNGKDLRAHVGDPSAGIDQRVRWLIEAARGLAAAHQAGVVHGDVKPANVMVANDDTVKILDFGLATAVPGCVGTPAYMAPEQIRGEALDGRADQFAWGVTAYELLTGRPPWPREDPLAAFAAILSDQPVVFPPKERDHGAALPNRRLGPGPHDPELPSDVADVILRTLRKRRDERFPNMDALLAALEANVRASVAAMHLPAAPPAPARRGIQRVRAAWLGLVPLAVAVGLVVFGLEIGRTGRGAPSPRASPLASVPPSEPPASTGIAALPISPKCSPEAAALYQRGLRALREATWRRALGLFEKASEIDPSCPEAQLRALIFSETFWPRVRQREQLRRALAVREALGERDRFVLDAWAFVLGPDAPREKEAVRVMDEAVSRFPNDAELRVLATIRKEQTAMSREELEASLEALGRAVEIDPEYADGWCAKAVVLGELDRGDDELGALDQCLRVAPGALDCMEIRSGALRRLGRCEEAAADARRWISWEPDQPAAYIELARSLTSRGASRDAIEEALALRWKHTPTEDRASTRLCDVARLAIWMGDFEGALRTADALERQTAGMATSEPHLCAALARVEALVELGRGTQAATVAAQAWHRGEAWVNDDPYLHFEYRKTFLLGVEVEHGTMTPDRWREAGDLWERANLPRSDPFERWVFRWGPAIGTRIRGAEALLSDPRLEAGPPAAFFNHAGNASLRDAYEGHIQLDAGDPAKAAPLLERATRSCQAFEYGATHVHARLWLGMAKEKLGDIPAACEAYRSVLERWGATRPPSVTAQDAERHSRALHCAR